MKQTRQLIIGLFISGVAWAASEYNDYLAALSARESSSNPTSVNKYGFLGSYQMGESALIDAGYYLKDHTPNTNDWTGTWTGKNGIHSKADFLANAAVQTQAIKDYNIKQWGYIQNFGLDSYLGQTIAGIVMTESGLLAGAHLVGVGGLKTFLQTTARKSPVMAITPPLPITFRRLMVITWQRLPAMLPPESVPVPLVRGVGIIAFNRQPSLSGNR